MLVQLLARLVEVTWALRVSAAAYVFYEARFYLLALGSMEFLVITLHRKA